MCRHIYDWNIVNCDVKQPIQVKSSRVGARTGTLKNPTKCLWRWEPDRRSNFFFSPPAHLCAVTYMTEISLIVTLNNQFNSTQFNSILFGQDVVLSKSASGLIFLLTNCNLNLTIVYFQQNKQSYNKLRNINISPFSPALLDPPFSTMQFFFYYWAYYIFGGRL